MSSKNPSTDPFQTNLESEILPEKETGSGKEMVTSPGSLLNSDNNFQNLSSNATFPNIPNYEILKVLGKGGMGVVYLAADRALNREVAIKMVNEVFISAEGMDRFQKEQQALAQMDDPGIVKLFNYGLVNDRPWFAMEYCQGGTLEEWLKENKAQEDWKTIARLVSQLAMAVQIFHLAGIIHRDLKPGNVFLLKDSLTSDSSKEPKKEKLKSLNSNPLYQYRLKVGDFGLARFKSSSVTRTGSPMGTPSYMAPEQGRGDKTGIGPGADVYGLGGILYTLLTRRCPFEGSLEKVLMELQDKDPTPPTKIDPAIPKDLETICLKCLEKDPRRRYGSAQALAEDLELFIQGNPILARSYTEVEKAWRWCLRNKSLAISIATAALFLFIGSLASSIFAINAGRQRDIARQLLLSERAETLRADSLDYQTHVRASELAWNGGRADLALHNLEQCPWNYRGYAFSYLSTLFRNKQILFRDHVRRVNSAVFSPDRNNILTASDDHTVKVWNTWTGELLFTLEGHKGEVTSAMFSPDGKKAVSSSFDGTSIVWDLETRKAEKILHGHLHRVLVSIFSPDGKTIASGGSDGTIRLWNAKEGVEIITPLISPTEIVMSLSFNSTGTLLVSSGEAILQKNFEKTNKEAENPEFSSIIEFSLRSPGVFLWDVKKGGQPIGRYKGSLGKNFNVLITPDDSTIVVASGDQNIYAWKINGDPKPAVLKGHGGRVYAVDISPDGQFLASGSGDQTIKIWDFHTHECVQTLRGHTGNVYSVAFGKFGCLLVSSSEDNSARVWNLEEDYGNEIVPLPKGSALRFAFSPTEDILAAVGKEGLLQLVSVKDKKEIWTVKAHEGMSFGVAFSPDGKWILTGGFDGKSCLWDRKTGKILHTFLGHKGKVMNVAFSPNGKLIASCGEFGVIRIWDSSKFEEKFIVEGHKGKVYSISFSPDGELFASGGDDGYLQVWSTKNGQKVNTLVNHPVSLKNQTATQNEKNNNALAGKNVPLGNEEIIAVTFSPDGKWLAGSSRNFLLGDKVIIWEITKEGKETGVRKELEGHYSFIYGLAFSPDTTRIITGSGDHTLKIWDIFSGMEVLSLNCEQNIVFDVGFDRNGICAAGSTGEKFIRLLTAKIQLEFLKLEGHSDTVRAGAFSPNGKWVATGGDDNSVVLWNAWSGKFTNKFSGFSGGIDQLAFSQDSNLLLVQDVSGKKSALELEFFQPVNRLPAWPVDNQLVSPCKRFVFWKLGLTGNVAFLKDNTALQNNKIQLEEFSRKWKNFPPTMIFYRGWQALLKGEAMAAKTNFQILVENEPENRFWHLGKAFSDALLGNRQEASIGLLKFCFPSTIKAHDPQTNNN